MKIAIAKFIAASFSLAISLPARPAPISRRTDRHLVEHGVFERVQYEAHPPRFEYKLTRRGEALRPVLMVLADWGETHLPAKVRRWGRRHTNCGHRFRPKISCSQCGEAIAPGSVTYDNQPLIEHQQA